MKLQMTNAQWPIPNPSIRPPIPPKIEHWSLTICYLLLTALAFFGGVSTFGQGFKYGEFFARAVSSAPAFPAPVQRVKCNDGSGGTMADSSGNNYAMTLHGTYSWETINSVNCIYIAGGGENYAATTSTISQMGGVQNASISVWIYTTDGYAAAGFTVEYYGSPGDCFYILPYGTSDVYVEVANGSGNYPYGAAPSTSAWHHHVLTFDGTQATAANRVKYYVDGSAVGLSQSGAGNPSSLPSASALGYSVLGQDNNRDEGGAYADYQLFTNTLTPSQVSALYSAGIDGTP